MSEWRHCRSYQYSITLFDKNYNCFVASSSMFLAVSKKIKGRKLIITRIRIRNMLKYMAKTRIKNLACITLNWLPRDVICRHIKCCIVYNDIEQSDRALLINSDGHCLFCGITLKWAVWDRWDVSLTARSDTGEGWGRKTTEYRRVVLMYWSDNRETVDILINNAKGRLNARIQQAPSVD